MGCCGQIVPAGQQCACQIAAARARKAKHDRNRPTASQRGYGVEWRKLRAEFMRLHPFCAFCGNPGEVVDHIVPHKGRKALLLSWSNLQTLCARCHNSAKQRQERAEAKADV